jgi:phage repressor protein C with HTH and peptisase S24 domain
MDDKTTIIGTIVREARENKGLTQTELADKLGTSQQTIEKIERGITKRSSYLLPISIELGIPGDKLSMGPTKQAAGASGIQIPGRELTTGVRDLPVYSAARGGGGELIVSSEPIEYVTRPEPLEGVLKGYGVRVVGDSMAPEFEEGDIALVHPNLQPRNGFTCIFSSEKHGEARAVIKRLVRVTETHWHVQQWNPPKGEKATYTLPRREWAKCQRVVGKYTRS